MLQGWELCRGRGMPGATAGRWPCCRSRPRAPATSSLVPGNHKARGIAQDSSANVRLGLVPESLSPYPETSPVVQAVLQERTCRQMTVRGHIDSVTVRGPMHSVTVRGPMHSVSVRGPIDNATREDTVSCNNNSPHPECPLLSQPLFKAPTASHRAQIL